MTALSAIRATAAARSGRLSGGAAFVLQLSILMFFLAASSAPTPLYAVYQAEWGFSPITVTVVFGVYAVAVLGSLLTVGSLSDHVGRRPVLLGALALQALAMVVFATAGGVTALLLARIIQGLSTGAAIGAIGAGLIDLNKRKGTIANGAGAMAGTAIGGFGSGLLVQYLPAPTHVVYVVLLAVFTVQAIGVLAMPESSTPKAGALASLKPELGLPGAARRPLLVAIPALVSVWALAGFYLSLGPRVIGLLVGHNSFVLGGLAPFALAASASVTVLLIRAAAPHRVMFLGTSALIVGIGITLLAVGGGSTPAFFAGTIIAGIGFGAGFQGALGTVLPFAAPHERAGVLSTIYLVCYLAMGVPAVVAGFLVVHGGLLSTVREYGVVLMVLAALALLGLAARSRQLAAVSQSASGAPVDLPGSADVEGAGPGDLCLAGASNAAGTASPQEMSRASR